VTAGLGLTDEEEGAGGSGVAGVGTEATGVGGPTGGSAEEAAVVDSAGLGAPPSLAVGGS